MERAEFFFDLGSPYAWLSAERIDGLFEGAGLETPVWRPVLLGGLFGRFGRSSWAKTSGRDQGIAEIERRARSYGLPDLVWPEPWPDSYLFAMRVATYADRVGMVRKFALASFRAAFTMGIDQSVPANVLAAAEAAGLDPVLAEAASSDPEVKLQLRKATDRAGDLGVNGIPSFRIGGRTVWGDDNLDALVREFGKSARP